MRPLIGDLGERLALRSSRHRDQRSAWSCRATGACALDERGGGASGWPPILAPCRAMTAALRGGCLARRARARQPADDARKPATVRRRALRCAARPALGPAPCRANSHPSPRGAHDDHVRGFGGRWVWPARAEILPGSPRKTDAMAPPMPPPRDPPRTVIHTWNGSNIPELGVRSPPCRVDAGRWRPARGATNP